MRYLVNGKEMKAIDMRSIEEYGIPSLVLMERASLAVADAAERLLWGTNDVPTRKVNATLEEKETERAKRFDKSIWCYCGLGNNGADGVAAARILHLRGYHPSIIIPTWDAPMSKEMEVQLEIAKALQIPIHPMSEMVRGYYDVAIDAVFGIGLSRSVEGVYSDMIGEMRWAKEEMDTKVLAVDIPSGISSDTGQILGTAVEADVTATFGEMKLGHALFPGRYYCGEVQVTDIGFVPVAESTAGSFALAHTKEDVKRIPKRHPYSHKGSYGKVLVAAGAKNMAGAAVFAAKAAYRTGAGLVKVLTVEENRTVIQNTLPEAILSTYELDWASQETEKFKAYIQDQTDWADVIILGPGLGREECSRILVEAVLEYAYVPIILDADGINLAARYPYLKNYFTENIILTPHLAECGRLLGKSVDEIKENLMETAKAISEQYNLTCVLKDAGTVIARKDGKLFVNISGSAAMAKGGSGDVLCGVIAGLLGLGMDENEAASLGVYVHGLAGEAAAKRYGMHSVLAGELADCIGEVINETI